MQIFYIYSILNNLTNQYIYELNIRFSIFLLMLLDKINFGLKED